MANQENLIYQYNPSDFGDGFDDDDHERRVAERFESFAIDYFERHNLDIEVVRVNTSGHRVLIGNNEYNDDYDFINEIVASLWDEFCNLDDAFE